MVSTTATAYPPLTKKQQLVLQIVAQFIVREGVAPTLREIAGEYQHSTISVLGILLQLERNGYVHRSVRKRRSIRVLYLPTAIAVLLPAGSPAITAVIPLTRKQLQTLQFIIAYWGEHQRSPTLGEIAHGFRVTKVTIHQHVWHLEREGCIRRTPGKARSIEVLYQPPGWGRASCAGPVTS